MTTALNTSRHTETDVTFAKTPGGELFMVNGIDRGLKWNGSVNSTPVVIGLDPPTAAPTVTAASTGGAKAGDYIMYYRFGDADGNYSNLSPIAELTMTAGQKFSWGTVPIASGTDSSARVTKRQLFRSLVGAFDIVYLVATLNDNSTTSYTTDTLTDEALAENEELPLLNIDDTLNANRFGVPPSSKTVAVWFQDRMFYLGDAIYSTGTVTVTNASATVEGSGVSFTKEFVGRMLYPAGSATGLLISAYVDSDTLTISSAYTGSTLTGVTYEIRPAPGELNTILFSEPDEPESVPQSQNKFILQQNQSEEDKIVGAYSVGQTLYVAQQRHTYGLTYVRQPHLDARASLLFRRGLFNQRCSDVGGDVMFAMDQYGPYAVSGSGMQDIGRPVANYWRDGLIDFTYLRRFFVRANPRTKTVRFYVKLSTDSGGVRSAFAYNYELDRWSLETYPWIVGAAVNLQVSGEYQYYVGKEDERFTREVYGASSDGIATGVSGVVSTAAGSTITSSSIFIAGHVGCPITFTSGTAKHSHCVITVRNSGTSVDVNAIPSGVAAGDTFVVGGIPWSMKTGIMTYAENDQQGNGRSASVVFKPTTQSGPYVDIRRFLNHKATPEVAAMDAEEREQVVGRTAGSADGTFLLYKDKTDYETVGYCVADWSGRSAERTSIDRYVAVEVRGVTFGEPVEISEIEIAGAR